MDGNVGLEREEIEAFVFSQKGTPYTFAHGCSYVFQLTKKYAPKNGGDTVLYWKCERWRDLDCSITFNTDEKIVITATISVREVLLHSGLENCRNVKIYTVLLLYSTKK